MAETNGSSDFTAVADEIFGTLLTITTILSGIYVSITFGWFGQAMFEPHPGQPMSPEMLNFALTGITLGLIFIVPLIFILMSWALSKFRDSMTWRVAAWSGLIYCLSQDFIGVVALFGFSYIATGAIIGSTLIIAGAFVLLVPPILGVFIGNRVGQRYSQSRQASTGAGKAMPAIAMVLFIFAVQSLLVASAVL